MSASCEPRITYEKGLCHSQTVSPRRVTSKMRPESPSQISVLPFGSRSADETLGLKNENGGLAWYSQTTALVLGSTSITRENGRPLRRVPLSNMWMLPFGSQRAWCWPDVVGCPKRQVSVLLALSMMPTRLVFFEENMISVPASFWQIELVWVHSIRRSSGPSGSSLGSRIASRRTDQTTSPARFTSWISSVSIGWWLRLALFQPRTW